MARFYYTLDVDEEVWSYIFQEAEILTADVNSEADLVPLFEAQCHVPQGYTMAVEPGDFPNGWREQAGEHGIDALTADGLEPFTADQIDVHVQSTSATTCTTFYTPKPDVWVGVLMENPLEEPDDDL